MTKINAGLNSSNVFEFTWMVSLYKVLAAKYQLNHKLVKPETYKEIIACERTYFAHAGRKPFLKIAEPTNVREDEN